MDTMLRIPTLPRQDRTAAGFRVELPGARMRRAQAAALAALALLHGAAALAQPMEGARTANRVAAAPSAGGATPDLASRLAALREDRLRGTVERAVPAPRVAAVVQDVLPPDVQVVVVPRAPDGLGSYHPDMALTGYEHVHSSRQERLVHGGRRGVIVVDARLEEQASRETIAFVLAHQYARHRLGRAHSDVDVDAFARDALVQMGLWSPRAVESAFALALGPGSALGAVPAIAQRMRALGLGELPASWLALAEARR
jgi:hypothetical protein